MAIKFTTKSMSSHQITVREVVTCQALTFRVASLNDGGRVLSPKRGVWENALPDLAANDIAGCARRYADTRMLTAGYIDRASAWA